jgi:hypothetical protein
LPAETFFKGFEIWLAKEHSKPEVKPSEEPLLMVEFEKFCQKHKDFIKGSRQRLLDVISETCFPFGLKKENEIQLLNMSLKDARKIFENTSDAKLLKFHKFGSKSLTLLRMFFEETKSNKPNSMENLFFIGFFIFLKKNK